MTDAPHRPPRLLLRPEDAADMLSLSRTTVYGLLRSGALRSVKVGGLRRIPVDALEEFVVRLCRDQGADASGDHSADVGVDGTAVLRAGQPAGAGRLATTDPTGTRTDSRQNFDRLDADATDRHEWMAP